MTGPLSNRTPADRNAEATVHVAQLDEKVTDALLWELMVQAGPVRHVYIPRNRITGTHFGYGFCEFHTPLDALYATKVLSMVDLFSKPIRVSQSSVDRSSQDVGAHLFIGNLVEEVDEKLLHDAFSAFGPLIEAPYIMRDIPNAKAKSYGFIKYSRFEHSDAAIAAMNGQYICNHPITVQYAFKKDSDSRERHGSQAERILAARALQASNTNDAAEQLQLNTLFSDRPIAPKRLLPQPNPPPGSVRPTGNFPFPAMPSVPIHGQVPVSIPVPMQQGTIPIPAGGPIPNAVYPHLPHGATHTIPPTMVHSLPLPPGIPPAAVMPNWPHPGPPINGMPLHPPISLPHGYDPTWSQGRRFGHRGPQPHHQQSMTDQRFVNRHNYVSHAPRPVEDDEAPPPPTN